MLIVFLMSIAAITVGSFVCKANSGEHLNWLFFVLIPLGVTALVLGVAALCNSLENRRGESFEIKLSQLGFNAQKSYVGHHVAVENTVFIAIDFDSKQFASNLIYNQVVPFGRIASGRTEILPYAMSDEKCVVQYVISVARKDDDMSYDYIELFDTVVFKSELGENDSLTEEMLNKYPLLNEILALDEDIQKIIKINLADGVALRPASDDEWQEQDMDSEQLQESEETEANYTKPPFADKRW